MRCKILAGKFTRKAISGPESVKNRHALRGTLTVTILVEQNVHVPRRFCFVLFCFVFFRVTYVKLSPNLRISGWDGTWGLMSRPGGGPLGSWSEGSIMGSGSQDLSHGNAPVMFPSCGLFPAVTGSWV